MCFYLSCITGWFKSLQKVYFAQRQKMTFQFCLKNLSFHAISYWFIEWHFLIFSIYLNEECCFSVWNHESNWRLGSEIYGIRCHCTPYSEKFIMSIRSNLNFVNTVLEIILNISRLPSNHTSTLPNYFWTSVCCLVSQTPRQLRIRNVLTSVSRLYIFN
jgi:uncharacterized membrane-anchored protein YitT (DUF2179 family)